MVESTDHSTSSTGNNTIDVSSHLYIHPSDSPSVCIRGSNVGDQPSIHPNIANGKCVIIWSHHRYLIPLEKKLQTCRRKYVDDEPLPSMAQNFALLVQEEKQREIKPNNQMFMEASSMNSSMNSSMHASSSGPSGGSSSSGSLGGRQQFRNNYSASTSYSGRPRPLCDYCKKLGDTKDKCYKLHGYPKNNTNGNGPISNGYGKGIATNAYGVDDKPNAKRNDGSSHYSNPSLTKDQYELLMSLLQ
ncbi:hypothetical protein KY285_020475 [Solanum tuberosum]|nr:hypothetical protein KY285_020475 [Solanum tuberosum]